jgi:hypothetical protein
VAFDNLSFHHPCGLFNDQIKSRKPYAQPLLFVRFRMKPQPLNKTMRNVLITGGSGYLGGSLLSHLTRPGGGTGIGTLFALVRTEQQGKQVKSLYAAEALSLDLDDQDGITASLVHCSISVVLFLINAFDSDIQVRFIKALATVNDETGVQTHFVTTTGAKLFSSHAGHPVDRTFSDMDVHLFEMQKNAVATASVPELGQVRGSFRSQMQMSEADVTTSGSCWKCQSYRGC